jgi:adenosine deaminase
MASLLVTMAATGVGVEVNLTSSTIILGVTGDRHPFATYRAAGVPLTLSTDDEGVSRIDLTHEYQLAVETYDLAYKDIKALARNALELSFIGGKSLFTGIGTGRYTGPCRKETPGEKKASADCHAFLAANEKAQMQWALEDRFHAFEARFNRR